MRDRLHSGDGYRLAGLLDGPRAQGAFLLVAVLGAPWSLSVADEAPVAVFTVLDGARVARSSGPGRAGPSSRRATRWSPAA